MAQVILFGGGDAGGLIITANGVRPIPPFVPKLRLKIKGLSALINGVAHNQNRESREMATLVNKMTNLVVEEIEAVIGHLDDNNSFVYQDDDGGFSCGSTGKPPIPIPWPPFRPFTIGELINAGVLERELIDFITIVNEKGIKIQDALESPLKYAQELGFKLSERSATDLQKLAPSQLRRITDSVEKEVVQFFHKVIEDGKYVETWSEKPYEVAKNLNIKLSDKARDRIIAGGASARIDPGSVMSPIVVGVIVGIIVMLVPTEAGRGRFEIEDLSGLKKF